MSQRRGSRTNWKPPRNRREVAVAVLASLAVVVVTVALVWFLRPNRDSGSSPTVDTVTPTTATGSTTTAPTTAPAPSSTP
jgi:ABC-type transporter Mla subunit MlaD